MADENVQPDPAGLAPAPEPTVATAAAPEPQAVAAPVADTAPQDPAQLVADFKKDELVTAADVVGADVPASATKAYLAEAIVAQQPAAVAAAGAAPVIVDNFTTRNDDDALLGSWVDVVSGSYVGRFGAYVSTVSHDKTTGYPTVIIIRTRDADNLLLEVNYSDVRPSDRSGGR
jgi:hypothetical protein